MHPSREDVAGLALGDQLATPDQRAHLAGCPECQAELGLLTRALRLAQEVTPEDLVAPRDHLWRRIREELWPDRSDGADRIDGVDRIDGAGRIDGVGRIDGISQAWRHIGVPAGFGSADELARASLSARPAWPGAHGTAVVEAGPHRARTVRIRMELGAERKSGAARLAAWLLTPDQSAMVRLGQLETVGDTDTSFDLPTDLDLLRYSVVDLSRQPADDDGTAAHSGDSIVRGVLA